jgi:hypothetical protein
MAPTPSLSQPQPARRSQTLTRWLVVALIVVVALGALFGGFEYLASSHSALAGVCGQLSFMRHGLPCDIPLPADVGFRFTTKDTTADGNPYTGWTFTTAQSSDAIKQLYIQGLHADGWPCATAAQLGSTLAIAGFHKADRANSVVEVIFDPQATGTTLAILLIQGQALPPGLRCS